MNLRDAVATFRGHRAPHFRIVQRKALFFGISALFVLLAVVGLVLRGLNYSIDFQGGAQLRYLDRSGATADDVESILAQYDRKDAQVQVVAGKNGLEINIRTRSLNDLGGPPQSQLTLTAKEPLSADDLRVVLAQYGLRASVTAKGDRAVAKTSPPLGELGHTDDVTLTYEPAKDLTKDEVQTTMRSVQRSSASILVAAGTVVIRTKTLTPPPPPTPSPTPSPSTSPTPSPSTTPTPSTTTTPTGTASPSTKATPSTTLSSGSGGAKPKRSQKGSKNASPKASPSASASPTASPAPSGSATPEVSASPQPTAKVPGPAEIKAALAKQAGIEPGDIVVTELSKVTKDDVLGAVADAAGIGPDDIDVKPLGGDERARLLAQLARQAGVETADINIRDFTATWGTQISKKALQGLIIFLILVTLYIAFRFEWKMSLSALTALGHDLVITVGIFALLGREVTPASVIAFLTILGYSLYDTVVIFDRVKENTTEAGSVALVARDTYSGAVNLSLNETLMRSVNTSLVVLLPILTLLIFGGSTLKDFAFALFVGVASGAYSSIFIASPMLALLKEREPRYQQIRQRAQRAQQQAGARAGAPLRAVSSRTAAASRTRGDGEAGEPAAEARPTAAAGAGAKPRPSGSRAKSGAKSTKRKTPAAKRRRR